MRPPIVCRFFNGAAGSCLNGDYCPFSHQQAAAPSHGQSSYSSSYQQNNARPGGYDPSKYKYVAPKKPEEVLTKLTRTISNEEAKPERTPSPKDIQVVVRNEKVKSDEPKKVEDLSSIYSDPSRLSSVDRKAFEAPSFTMGFIPVDAPSRDLC